MATYHGIVKAECLDCGYTSEDDTDLELWNDLGNHGDGVSCAERFTRWTLEDGDVSIVEHDDEHGWVAMYKRTDVS